MSRSLIVSYHHLVWATYKREATLCERIEPLVLESFVETCEGLGLELLAANGAWDHVHLLVRWNGRASYDDVVCRLKSRSWRACYEAGEGDPSLPPAPRWQRGFSVFTLREEGCEGVARYIRRQKEHHRRPATLIEVLERLCED